MVPATLFQFIRCRFQEVLRIHAEQRGREPSIHALQLFCQNLDGLINQYEENMNEIQRLKHAKTSAHKKHRRAQSKLDALAKLREDAESDLQLLSEKLSVAREKILLIKESVLLGQDLLANPIFPPEASSQSLTSSRAPDRGSEALFEFDTLPCTLSSPISESSTSDPTSSHSSSADLFSVAEDASHVGVDPTELIPEQDETQIKRRRR